MMDEKRALKRGSAALLVTLLAGVMFMSGCGKEESKEAPKPWEPESYMKDEAFTGKMKEKQGERKQLMKKYVEAKAEFDKAVAADPKMEKPETKVLKEKLDAVAKEYSDNRKETMKAVRERLTPKADKKENSNKNSGK